MQSEIHPISLQYTELWKMVSFSDSEALTSISCGFLSETEQNLYQVLLSTFHRTFAPSARLLFDFIEPNGSLALQLHSLGVETRFFHRFFGTTKNPFISIGISANPVWREER